MDGYPKNFNFLGYSTLFPPVNPTSPLNTEEEEENTSMESKTDGQARFTEAVARYALPGETWLTNSSARPYYKGESPEEIYAKLRERYPNFDLRFDQEHIVFGMGVVIGTSDKANEYLKSDPRDLQFAVYGKLKSG